MKVWPRGAIQSILQSCFVSFLSCFGSFAVMLEHRLAERPNLQNRKLQNRHKMRIRRRYADSHVKQDHK